MKTFFTISIVSLLLFSCKVDQKQDQENLDTSMKTDVTSETYNYPETLSLVFEAHGGIDRWKTMNNLSFQMPGRNGVETHITDLNNRWAKIQTDSYALGFDGSNFWLDQEEDVYDPSRVKFYHNLMFYFYAMPFILGDDGITYTDVPALEFEGKMYHGTKVSYENNVGFSDNDNYILYSEPETNQMAWLAYTVTFGKDASSDNYNYIKYDEWQEVNGLLLPKTLQWYNVVDSKPTTMRNAIIFENVAISETPLETATFTMPKDAMKVE